MMNNTLLCDLLTAFCNEYGYDAELTQAIDEPTILTFRNRGISNSVIRFNIKSFTLDEILSVLESVRQRNNLQKQLKNMEDKLISMSIDTDMSPATRNYIDTDIKATNEFAKRYLNSIYGKKPILMPRIKNVIFNDPATIVFWSDNTKTVVKAQDEPFDPEKGLAMAICKKALGNEGNYYNEIKKWLPKEKNETIIGKVVTSEANSDGILVTAEVVDGIFKDEIFKYVNDTRRPNEY